MELTLVDPVTITRTWWAVLLRGVAAIVFGLVTIVAPGISLLALVLVFGAFALVDGVLLVTSAIRHRGVRERWGLPAVHGIASMLTGVAAFVWPGITALALLLLIAVWAIFTGVMQIAAAIELRRELQGEWLLVASGILSVALGILLMLFPGPGALAVVVWVGAWALLFGGLLVALGLRLRSLGHHHLEPEHADEPTARISHPRRL